MLLVSNIFLVRGLLTLIKFDTLLLSQLILFIILIPEKIYSRLALKFTLNIYIRNTGVLIGFVPLLQVGTHRKEKGNSSFKIFSYAIHVDANASDSSTDIGIIVLDVIDQITNTCMFSWQLKGNVLSSLLQLNK